MADVSKEYAEALFAVACESGAENDVMTALDGVLCAFDENPEYAELLASPGISLGERLGAIETTFGRSVPECVLSYLMLLCEKGRIAIFRESVGEYRNLLNIRNSLNTAKVISAIELSKSEKQALKEKLEKISGSTVELDCVIDPDILGGVIVEMNGRVIDGSLRHRLREVKEVIEQ